MRLDLFEIIDEACYILQASRDDFMEAEVRIIQCLKSLLVNTEDSIMEMSSRIKTPMSLREKIVRNKLYHNMNTGKDVIDSLHDLVGVTIKCQFIKEEKQIYERIQNAFGLQNADGYYFNDKFPNILFDLDMTQPQYQKNGNAVYRLDGFCMIGSKKINFELQIKAIVFTFWSEIEHKIVYKNNNYSLNNDFIGQLLNSIRSSLNSIDQQLSIIYSEMQTRQSHLRLLDEGSIKQVLAKAINDTFISKIQNSIGFTVNFKRECDLISDFMIRHNGTHTNEQQLLVEVIGRLHEIQEEAINFEHPIEFDDEIASDDRFTQIISSAFLWYMNSDFEWYLFFKMLFSLMHRTPNDNLTLFVSSYRERFANPAIYRVIRHHFDDVQYEEIVDEIMAVIALTLVEIGDISILHEEKLDALVPFITKFCDIFIHEITTYKSWLKYQTNVMGELRAQLMSRMKE